MAAGLASIYINDILPSEATARNYDLGVWAAGYEARSSWLVSSAFKPDNVTRWLRVEFQSGRDALSAKRSLAVECGSVLGGGPGHANHDGHWATVWKKAIEAAYADCRRPLDVFIDYSSMPRAVYGTFLLESFRDLRRKMRSLTFAYVPGIHAADVEGARSVTGLRALPGVEGRCVRARPCAVLGLGFDGILAEAVVELFQLTHFSCLYASPGWGGVAEERVVTSNRRLLSRAELVGTAPAASVPRALAEVERICDWYKQLNDVLLVPMGPKPHVLACILAAVRQPEIGFRFPETSSVRPVQVEAVDNAIPAFCEIHPE